MTKQERLIASNNLISAIAGCGRNFFSYQDNISHLELDANGRVWFYDYYTEKRIYTHYQGKWKGFTSGGTLKSLIERLKNFICFGYQLPSSLFKENSEGWHPWGYGKDIEIVYKVALKNNIIDNKNS